MLLTDYHLIFIVICFIMLIFQIYFIFIEGDKKTIIGGGILSAINWGIAFICWLSFFGVGIPGVDSSGEVSVTVYSGMHSYFIMFFALQWINFAFIIAAWYIWMGIVYEDSEKSNI